jgi:hypothetical protein
MRSILTAILAYIFGVNVEIDGRSYGPAKPSLDPAREHLTKPEGVHPDGHGPAKQPAATLACR